MNKQFFQWLVLALLGLILGVYGRLHLINSRYVLFLISLILTITVGIIVFIRVSREKDPE